MSKGTKGLVLPFLFTLGCSLAGGPAGATIRVEPRVAITGWLSWILVHTPFGLGRNGSQVDPNGQATPKNGSQVDPDGQTKPNKNGIQLDPNGQANPNKYGNQLDPNGGSPVKP